MKLYKSVFKRLIDILISFFGIIVFSPLFFLLFIILVWSNDGMFFIQIRPGKNGNLFKLIKFKTMTDSRDLEGKLMPDNERITFSGKLIRSLSLDELPQLINVLKGDMSIVGPRPLLVQYLPLYSKLQSRRHEVKPGITGWAQVNGRNAISWEQKFDYDLWYVDNLSLWLDIKILLLTIKKVFFRDGINSTNEITMEPFRGSKIKMDL